jgi:hypothetical protein
MTKAQLEQELANVRAERDTLLEQLQRLQTDDEDASVLHTMRANAQPDGVVVSAPEGTRTQRVARVGRAFRDLARTLNLRGVWAVQVTGKRMRGGAG